VSELNVDRLRELSGHLRNACRQLHDLGDQGEETFLGEAKTVNSAKYLLIVATEAALDICNHLAAKKGGRSPEDYADCMTILGELGVLKQDLKVRMSENGSVSQSPGSSLLEGGGPGGVSDHKRAPLRLR
jgi:uncharacterized protein YutE (UPF0331/DUF86 family)